MKKIHFGVECVVAERSCGNNNTACEGGASLGPVGGQVSWEAEVVHGSAALRCTEGDLLTACWDDMCSRQRVSEC